VSRDLAPLLSYLCIGGRYQSGKDQDGFPITHVGNVTEAERFLLEARGNDKRERDERRTPISGDLKSIHQFVLPHTPPCVRLPMEGGTMR
jgi:hypothetical protein